MEHTFILRAAEAEVSEGNRVQESREMDCEMPAAPTAKTGRADGNRGSAQAILRAGSMDAIGGLQTGG